MNTDMSEAAFARRSAQMVLKIAVAAVLVLGALLLVKLGAPKPVRA